MIYREYTPCIHLAPYVECYWSAQAKRPPFREQESLIPDGTIELIFNFGDSYAHIVAGKKNMVKGSHVIGIRRQTLTISQTAHQNFFCVRFKLGGFFPFFRIPAYEFANNIYQLTELFDQQLNELEYQLFEAADDIQRVKLSDNFLLKRLQSHAKDYWLAHDLYQTMITGHASSVKMLSDQFNTNYKTIERKFLETIGVTPAQMMAIRRFNHALHLMYSRQCRSLTEVACTSGYYDQAHFIRQFKKFTRLTPRRFLEQQYTIVKVIQPALAQRLSNMYNLP